MERILDRTRWESRTVKEPGMILSEFGNQGWGRDIEVLSFTFAPKFLPCPFPFQVPKILPSSNWLSLQILISFIRAVSSQFHARFIPVSTMSLPVLFLASEGGTRGRNLDGSRKLEKTHKGSWKEAGKEIKETWN